MQLFVNSDVWIFAKGGNFSIPEREAYKLRVRKMDAKLSRFEALQVVEEDKILPERTEKGTVILFLLFFY